MAGVADFTQFVDVRARNENPRFAAYENDGPGLALGKFIQNQIETLHLPEPENIDLRIRVIEHHPRDSIRIVINSRGFHYARSRISAPPCPPPTQAEARPVFRLRRFI